MTLLSADGHKNSTLSKLKEEEMIEPVQTFLENKGYTVYKGTKKQLQWKVAIGKGESQIIYQPDVVGFRWRGDGEIDAVAVECKVAKNAKNILSALSQATVYQMFFPRTYIVSTLSIKNMTETKGILEKRELGYLYFDCSRRKVIQELQAPVHPPSVFDQNLHEEFVGRKAAIFLASKEQRICNKVREIGQQERVSFLTGTGLSPLGLWIAF
jgi:hypothetical protein